MPASQRQFRGAFSLIEITVVVLVLGILGAMAITNYGSALGRYQASLAAQRIAADIALTQAAAKTSSAGQSIVFTTSTSSYTLSSYAAPLGGPVQGNYTVTLTADPYHSTLVSASFAGSATLTYDRFGQPSSGGTIVVQGGNGFSHTITVDPNTGKASVQ